MTMVSKLFSSRKFLIICIIANSLFILIISGFLLLRSSNKAPVVAATSLSHQEPSNVTAYETEKSFQNLIAGSTYTSGDKTFDFKSDNVYQGYFNKKYESVKDASYDIAYDSERHSGVILIKYKDSSILYDIDIDDQGNISLISDTDKNVKYRLK